MKICMIVPNSTVKGGIAAVVNGYREHNFGERYRITYVESYCDGSKMRKLLKALGSYFCFLKVIITNRPDLIHIHSSFGPSFYRKMPFIYLGKMFRIPIINHIHGAEFDPFYGKASEQKKRLIQKVYRKCTRLIALSDEWKKNLKLIVPEDKITVLPNYCIVPEKVNLERKRQILFLGEIGKRKGCFDIPDILEKANLRGLDATMVFAGAGSREDEEALKKELAKVIARKTALDIKIMDVKNPDKHAQLVAENIAQQLENRISFRRAMKSAMSRTLKTGAKGIKASCSGRLGGADMARTEFYSEGTIPLQTLRADIDYGFAEADTTYGKIGVKVWVYNGEVLPTKNNSKKEGSDK